MKLITLKHISFFIFSFTFFSSNIGITQTIWDTPDTRFLPKLKTQPNQNSNSELMEICNNDLDDDGDGLVDCDDPDCYFTDPLCECHETEIIWTVDGK